MVSFRNPLDRAVAPTVPRCIALPLAIAAASAFANDAAASAAATLRAVTI